MENKTIVALACSPSKGWNSDTMLDQFMEGIREIRNEDGSEAISIEKIYLYDIDFALYDFDHKQPDPETEQGFIELVEKIKKANGLVVATPTHNFGASAKLKNFIDRIGYFALDYKQLNRMHQPTGQLGYLNTYSLVSGGAPNHVQKLLAFAYPGFWLNLVWRYYGARCRGHVYGGKLKAENRAQYDHKLMQKCRLGGIKFAQTILDDSYGNGNTSESA